jgi:hypothetical protein
MTDPPISKFVDRPGDDDPGCDVCLERLHIWVEGVSAGLGDDAAEPRVAAHLRSCADCSEDARGLLALVNEGDKQG